MTNVLISKGAPTLVSLGLGAGTVLVNNDSANSIWVSSDASVTPGNGTLLAPLSNITWAGSFGVYACLDSGGTSPVVMSYTTDITSFNNPVAVGTAVALNIANTALNLAPATLAGIGTSVAGNPLSLATATQTSLASAVGTSVAGNPLSLSPATQTNLAAAVGTAVAAQTLNIGSVTGGNINVANTTVLGNNVAVAVNQAGIPGLAKGQLLGTGAIPTNLNAAIYSTLNVQFTVLTAGYFMLWCTDGVNPYQYNFKRVNVCPGVVYFSYPVTASNFTIQLGGGATGKNYYVYGTNIVSTDLQIHGCDSYVNYSLNQAWTVNQTVNLGTITSRGGVYSCRALATGTGKGYFGYQDYSSTGTPAVPARLIPTTAGATGPVSVVEFYGQVSLPPGTLQLFYQSQIAATYQVIWELTASIT